MKLEYAMAIAILPALCLLVGLVIGTLRYVKYGKEIRQRVEEDFREKELKMLMRIQEKRSMLL